MLCRLAAVAGVVLGTLALTASAQAAPSAPVITTPAHGIVCGDSVTVKWTASTPDPGGSIAYYRADMFDLTINGWSWKTTFGLQATFGGLKTGHQYLVRVKALQIRNGVATWSPSTARAFTAICPFYPVEKLKQWVEYNPDWGCPMCGVRELQFDDPVIYREVLAAKPPVAEQIRGFEIEADGSVRVM
jgi:hypothetical protein